MADFWRLSTGKLCKAKWQKGCLASRYLKCAGIEGIRYDVRSIRDELHTRYQTIAQLNRVLASEMDVPRVCHLKLWPTGISGRECLLDVPYLL